MWFLILKWIHVLSAITAVGANITYGLWISRAARDPAALPFVLRNISFIDTRVANPCYALLLATGLIMAFTAPIPLTTPWLLTGLILYAFAALLGILVYAPAARRQRSILDREGLDSAAYQRIARTNAIIGSLLTLDVMVIVFLMVVKPGLWS
jgi:uncharacterized membrane protein